VFICIYDQMHQCLVRGDGVCVLFDGNVLRQSNLLLCSVPVYAWLSALIIIPLLLINSKKKKKKKKRQVTSRLRVF